MSNKSSMLHPENRPDSPVLRGEVCQYCGRDTELVSSTEVYGGRDFGMLRMCRPCDAYVGCHKDSNKAKGSVAKADLRADRKMAHEAFDRIWRKLAEDPLTPKGLARNMAYAWMAKTLGIDRKEAHMAMLSKENAMRITKASRYIMDEGDWRVWSRRIEQAYLEQQTA